MLSLDSLLVILDNLRVQGVLTQTQADRLAQAATAMLTTFASEQEYRAKFDLFLALLGGKWV